MRNGILFAILLSLVQDQRLLAMDTWVGILPEHVLVCSKPLDPGDAARSTAWQLLRDKWPEKARGELGAPLAVPLGAGSDQLEPCLQYFGGEKPPDDLEQRVLPSTRALFAYCPGGDHRPCFTRLRELLGPGPRVQWSRVVMGWVHEDGTVLEQPQRDQLEALATRGEAVLEPPDKHSKVGQLGVLVVAEVSDAEARALEDALAAPAAATTDSLPGSR